MYFHLLKTKTTWFIKRRKKRERHQTKTSNKIVRKLFRMKKKKNYLTTSEGARCDLLSSRGARTFFKFINRKSSSSWLFFFFLFWCIAHKSAFVDVYFSVNTQESNRLKAFHDELRKLIFPLERDMLHIPFMHNSHCSIAST